jgi:hypothetical protein
MLGVIHPVHQYVFMAWYLVKHRDKFIKWHVADELERMWTEEFVAYFTELSRHFLGGAEEYHEKDPKPEPNHVTDTTEGEINDKRKCSSVSIVTRLRAGRQGLHSGQEVGFFHCHRDLTGSVAHRPSYPVGTGDSFIRYKAAGP